MIAVNAFDADDCIERLKPLSGEEHCGAKSADVIDKMQKNMEFGLVEPAGCPARRT